MLHRVTVVSFVLQVKRALRAVCSHQQKLWVIETIPVNVTLLREKTDCLRSSACRHLGDHLATSVSRPLESYHPPSKLYSAETFAINTGLALPVRVLLLLGRCATVVRRYLSVFVLAIGVCLLLCLCDSFRAVINSFVLILCCCVRVTPFEH